MLLRFCRILECGRLVFNVSKMVFGGQQESFLKVSAGVLD